ncbi:MAG: UvrD-helicase domain-containing protein [Salinivirgaceae bacterium]|nr:UvrD-helicase domain-containing protein [Salinivirgaceae bacterium]MDD4747176.1 UvrD-helicase domain-containing protein [Salinivirgaceae bacterium]
MENNYLKELNPAQREAVVSYDSPCLIIAGAGSGKTRVLTFRIAHLLANNVLPYKILALTFTNKAAKEMRERISKLVGHEKAKDIWMGTFHAVFARILRNEAERLGFTKNFTIYDSQDSQNLIKSLVKERKLNPKDYKPNLVYGRISKAKNNLITPAIYATKSDMIGADRMNKVGDVYMLYKMYCDRCKIADAMDFDDLLLNMNILLRDNPDILRKYQNRFNYILVDEYQDTNFSQYRIIKLLSSTHQNLCVVGDDAQSIYAFRGARIENIFNFQSDYPNHKIVKLEQNYRSTQTIVNAANSLIAQNSKQLPKTIFSQNDVGNPLRLFTAVTDVEEGFKIINQIISDVKEFNLKYSDIAILYRNNAQSRIFEEALRKRTIPYHIYGGTTFYQRKEIKDCLAYFRMAVNPNDDIALQRVINYPSRGIGETTMSKIATVASALNVSFWKILTSDVLEKLKIQPRTLEKIKKFTTLIASFIQLEKEVDAYDCAINIVRTSGLHQDLSVDKTIEGQGRLQNVEELFNGVRDFVAEQYNETQTLVQLSQYMENVALLTDLDKQDDSDNKVSLMTVHSSKGLEFNSVFIVGMEEQLFPSQMASFSEHDIEEERRLFYVAITRAQMIATLSWAKQRSMYGSFESRNISRFVKEIDQRYLQGERDYEDPSASYQLKGYRAPTAKLSFKRPEKGNQSTPRPSSTQQEQKDYKGTFIEFKTLPTGQKILHQKFGHGTVVAMDGTGLNTKAIIKFETGEKTLLLRFARLQLLD